MAGGNYISENLKAIAFSRRRKSKSSIPFLPDEIIVNILVHLPAEVLYNVMRYVSKGWYNIIRDPDFINAHLHKSTVGIFVQNGCREEMCYFAETRKSEVCIRKMGRLVPPLYSSCNGLVLLHDLDDLGIFYIKNPVTRQLVVLPPVFFDLLNVNFSAIGYAPSIRKYKVVLVWCGADREKEVGVAVMTVGVDRVWRQIEVKSPSKIASASIRDGINAGGYIYWADWETGFVVAMDVETEVIQEVPGPPQVGMTPPSRHMVWGSSLALVSCCYVYMWEVWVLSEISRKGWRKLLRVDLRGVVNQPSLATRVDPRSFLEPVVLLKNGELLILKCFGPLSTCAVINIRTGEVSSFMVPDADDEMWWAIEIYAHVNSLVRI